MRLTKFFTGNIKKKAAVFIHYNYLLFTLKNKYNTTPEIKKLIESVTKNYQLIKTDLFADCSNQEVVHELVKNIPDQNVNIIDTQILSQSEDIWKEMTDFVMLDHIYRCTAAERIDIFILFVGTESFQPVIKYLVQDLKKEVVICGVRDSVSELIKAIASKTIEIPSESEISDRYYKMIFQNFDYLKGKNIHPTFISTVKSVSLHNKEDYLMVKKYLQKLVDNGYIFQKEEMITKNKKIRTVHANWEKILMDGLWKQTTDV